MARSIKISVKVEGLKEAEEALLELPKATQGNVLKRAVGIPAADYADYASKLAPKRAVGGGNLKREIKVERPRLIAPGAAAYAQAMAEGSTKAEAAVAARNANREAGGKGKAVRTFVGPTKKAFYGVFQEFGTRFFPPKPFMRPAWDAMKRSMLDTFVKTLWGEIKKAADRRARKAARDAAKMK